MNLFKKNLLKSPEIIINLYKKNIKNINKLIIGKKMNLIFLLLLK